MLKPELLDDFFLLEIGLDFFLLEIGEPYLKKKKLRDRFHNLINLFHFHLQI